MVNLQLIFFVFISTALCVYYDSFTTASEQTNDSEQISLSEETINRINTLNEKEKKFAIYLRKKYKKSVLKHKMIVASQTSLRFHSAYSSTKATIDEMKALKDIFKGVELSDSDKIKYLHLSLPKRIKDLMVKHDPGRPANIEDLKQYMDYHQARFRNFFFRLKGYDKTSFFNTLRTVLKDEFKEQDQEKVYIQFSATIVRDYRMFCVMYRTPHKNFLSVLFEEYPGWYFDGTHIKHINILLKAYYGKNHGWNITGFKCMNKLNQTIEIPVIQI